MTSLINQESGVSLKALKYAPPTKFTPVSIVLDGETVEARVTTARGKSYTYFPLRNVGFYVEGTLTDGQAFTVDGLPEGELKGPAWDSARKSYYVPKRPKKDGENAKQDSAAQSESSNPQGGEPQAQVEGEADKDSVGVDAASPRARRKRGE